MRASLFRVPSPRSSYHALVSLALLSLALLTPGSALLAQDEEREPGWYDQAELSFVQTGGNAEASTLAFKNSLERVWDDALFGFHAGALRAESTSSTRFAIGTPEEFEVIENDDSDLTAENAFARLRYQHDIRPDFFWFGGVGWERNEFAGFSDRLSAIGGVGNVWWEREGSHFRTDYGLTYTQQDDLVEDTSIDDSFLGVQVSWDYLRQLGANTSYQNLLAINQNVDETDDLRADMINAMQVSMSERLALKVSLQLVWDNLPALVAVPLVDGSGGATGTLVVTELDDLDTLFTVALVVSF